MHDAALIIIGNEILSGRTQDTNTAFLAKALNEVGVQLRHVRVIPDVEAIIIATINECRAQYAYLFTTGGIGPTHDDITSLSVAKAFGRELLLNPEANQRLLNYYAEGEYNEARQKMAFIPEGAELIDNPVSAAPGFRIENVFVLAGVPRIMQAMFDGLKSQLQGEDKMLSLTLNCALAEAILAKGMTRIQNKYIELVEIGSYPQYKDGKVATSLVLRGKDEKILQQAEQELQSLIDSII